MTAVDLTLDPEQGSGDDRRRAFAGRWASALGAGGSAGDTLTGAVDRLVEAARGDDPGQAAAVGAALVDGGFADPSALGESLRLLATDLPALVPESASRLTELTAAFATGFAAANRNRATGEQELVRRAALAAQSEAQRALRLTVDHHATHDRLTGLANREVFVERLTTVLRERTGAERIGLCLLDLDGFKVVNDSLGHPVGDQLLAAVGERLDALSGDALVARLGGDEFAILITGTTGLADVERMAAEIVRSLSVPFPPADGRLTLPASIGVLEHAASDASAADLMRAAELTMYRAKSEHRGRWAVYDPHRNDQRVARYTLATEMPAALERDEFVVEFQPLVGLADGAVRGAEALVRWRHRELGLLSPKRFVGLAEETGAIVPIGRRVLELACRQASRWPVDDAYVSVNLAAAQLADPNLVDDVVRVLEETGLEPGRLQLELAAGTVATVNSTPLRRLAALGVRLAVGDVSAGWAHLPLLRDFSIDVLKLSGGLVQRLTASDRTALDDQILESLLVLAHALGLQVVAEGIESAEQRDRLRALGCDTGQGWYYAPALGPEEFIRYLPGSPAFAGR
ncbi:putative bifunctional diguanylate cyclase/phosphodiesterase [Cryptosporangium sp. NPDC048952]|uniref:putative bifunctional diguanylate cyclase/phosphodiesterase n=1 Tax=Cryptosporangium sp. NPDC048952 TaxID=3363961 RepID=UPI0037109708